VAPYISFLKALVHSCSIVACSSGLPLWCAIVLTDVNQTLNTAFTGGVVFTQALILAMTYTACQDDRGSKSSFFVITIPTQWVPFAMLIMTFVMSGPNATLQQATGIVAAHLYDFLTRIYPEFGGGTNFIKTPLFVRRWFEPTVATASNRSYGMAFTPAAGQPAARATGASTGGVLPESWKSRGSGHRLGGE
jgi:Derlin-2/3